jgi:hypothetical protein
MKPMFQVLFGSLAKFLAIGIGWIRVNRIILEPGDTLVKTRTAFSHIPIRIGNLVFRYRCPAIQVLPTQEWILWEVVVARSLRRIELQPVKQGVRFPRLAGESLIGLLKNPNLVEADKLIWIEWASRALADLHQHCVTYGTQSIDLSHGDASVTNTMIDTTKQTAAWFDFDLQHDLTAPTVCRQSDDLRSLIFTAAASCQWSRLNAILTAIRNGYSNDNVWEDLNRKFNESTWTTDIFLLAQLRRAGPAPGWRQRLEALPRNFGGEVVPVSSIE